MRRLTFKEPDGTWGIVGMNKDNEEQKMYGAACKLLDHEETGLDPVDVEQLKEDSVQVIINKLTEKRNRIEKEIENTEDSYNRLLKMKVVGRIDTAVKVIGDYICEYCSGSRKEENE